MRKILLFALLSPAVAFATTCESDLMGLGMSPALAVQICHFVPDSIVIPSSTLANIPTTCAVGQIHIVTNDDDCASTASGDGAICVCKTTNTWALMANF